MSAPALDVEPRLRAAVDGCREELVAIRRDLHRHPELSHQEARTAQMAAERAAALGFAVHSGVGGHGVTADLDSERSGPVLMLRADMDALPVLERDDGRPVRSEVDGVMHACGHDGHVAMALGAASALVALRDTWTGRVRLCFQPAEERAEGAMPMIEAGAADGVDRVLGIHLWAPLQTGRVAVTPGVLFGSADSFTLTLRGRGGHGGMPHTAVDPVVAAAQIIVALQTIVSRETSPLDSAVVTVGSIHGGAKRNVIPDEVQLLMTVRTYKPEVRKRVLASIDRIARGIALAAGVPDDRAPIVELLAGESVEATWNDPALTERLAKALTRDMGTNSVVKMDPLMVSEDFGHFALDRKIPATMLNVGAVDPAKIASGERLPSLHSSKFLPVAEPTLRGAIKAMVVSSLELLR